MRYARNDIMRFAVVALIATCLLAPWSVSAASKHAGKVVYAFGDVQATGNDGKARALSRGDRFGPGDTIQTRNGRTQLRFTDGGFAALQPNTQYKVEDYNFEGRADGNERSFMNLVRGSVRLVTGLIGRANKNNFRLRTAVATIGIRGTAGRVSHCDGGNCGANGPGTSLSGYGGTWDLQSGSYSGPVEPGQATFCNGASCFDIPNFGQRESVVTEEQDELAELDELQDENDQEVADSPKSDPDDSSGVEDGANSDSEGQQCDVGGSCGSDLVVGLGLVGAGADSSGNQGDTGATDNLAVVLNNGAPVAAIMVEPSNGDSLDPPIDIITTDVGALRQAFLSFPDAQTAQFGLKLLERIPLEKITALQRNAATVAEEDFGRTKDELLLFGRWQQGLVLDILADFDGNVSSSLRELRNFQSEHFIFGSEPGPLPLSGVAGYRFSGGTRSTAADGSSIGLGVTSGQLLFDFANKLGSLEMDVRHAGSLYRVFGQLQFENDKFFFETSAVAIRGISVFNVGIDGFFSTPGDKFPRAAGLAYVIETPVNIIGVAGFSRVANAVQQGFTGPAANGSYVSFATNFKDGLNHLTSNAFDFIVDGSGNIANRSNNVVTSFSSDFHPGLCAPPCTFNQAGAPLVRDATGPGGASRNAALGADWGRFAVGHATVFNGLVSSNGSAHVISVEVPTPTASIPPLSSGKQGIYNVIRGGTRPTMVFVNGGVEQNEVVGQLTQATMNIIFDTGDISAQFQGTVPGGFWQLAGSAIGSFNRNNGVHSLNFNPGISFVQSANVSDGLNCGAGCQLSGHTHFDIAGAGATAVVGSFQGYTMQPSDPAFTVSGTFVSEGSVVAYP